jgi:hypothetical protein
VDEAKLEGIPLFAGLTLDQRASVASVCEQLDVEEGATLVKEGDFGFARVRYRVRDCRRRA